VSASLSEGVGFFMNEILVIESSIEGEVAV